MDLPSVTMEEIPESQPSKTYSSAVLSKSILSKHQLAVCVVDGNPVARVPAEIFEDSVPLWEDLIIGKFLSTTAPHVGKIHMIVNKIWPLGDKSVKIDVFEVNETTVKFRIKERQIRDRVLRRGMWNIADIPMVVSKWSPIIEESQPDIQTIPMWIAINPQKMFSWKGLGFIASAVGDPKRLHPDTILCKSFEEAKVFVEADLSKELPKTFRFQADNGLDAEVEFKYPRLPPKCASCSKWGHLQEACLLNKSKKQLSLQKKQDLTQLQASTTGKSELNHSGNTTQAMVVVETSEPVVEEKESLIKKDKAKVGTLIEANLEVSGANGTNQKIPENQSETEEGWSNVSPSKLGRILKHNQNEEECLGSPTRFSVLEEETGGDIEQKEENKLHSPIRVPAADSEIQDVAHEDIAAVGNVIEKRYTLLGFSVSDEDTEPDESSDSDSGAGMVDILTPSGQIILRERPVKPSIKAMQMQSSKARGRGNRGRGNHGGRG